ncbi:MAG: RNA 2',3'-cyclic phosphodiesterase [Chloroflexota bacterium]|jgi:2'-5' RNA ligase
MKTIRSFIAIEIAADVRRSLAELQEELVNTVPIGAVRWVAPGNIHLTLKFLGDTEMSAVGPIESRLEEMAASFEPFEVRLGKVGCFPNPRRPRVIWVGIEGDLDLLMRLQQEVEQSLSELGWPAEKRRFHPHLTLGRVKDSRQVIEARMPWGRQRVTGQQRVTEVCLIESDLQPTGAVYTVLKRASLAG